MKQKIKEKHHFSLIINNKRYRFKFIDEGIQILKSFKTLVSEKSVSVELDLAKNNVD